MPAFNAGRFIDEAIRSIRDQSLTEWEMIVVDDGSTDDTRAIAARHAIEDPRIRVVQQRNLGQAAANNLAIPQARADYVARMDADDASLPGRLEKLCRALDEDPALAAVGSKVRCTTDAGEYGGIHGESGDPTRVQRAMHNRGECLLLNPGAAFRKRDWLAVGGERACFGSAHDVDLWMRIGESRAIRILPDVLVQYRIHDKNVSLTGFESQGLALLGAYRAAEFRRAGKADPFACRAACVDRESLIGIGCTRAECEAAVLDCLGGQLTLSVRAQLYGRARKLLEIIQSRRSCPDNPRRQAFQAVVGECRVALGERGMAGVGRVIRKIAGLSPQERTDLFRATWERLARTR